ncbi:MAG: hypothetical protein IJM76_02405 [Lachnospiraceae bacterium]|nr:hypothetical protein [Lachnospiraceae bacterium]
MEERRIELQYTFDLTEEGGRRCIRFPLAENVPAHEVRMLTENRIPGIPAAFAAEIDGVRYLSYDVSGLVSLKTAEEAAELPVLLRALIFSMARTSDALSAYLLKQEGLLLLPETVFLREESGEVFFCYLPGEHGSVQEAVEALAAWLIRVISSEKQEEILLLYGLYRKSREENVTLKTLAEYWQREAGGDRQMFSASGPAKDPAMTEAEEEIFDELFGIGPDPAGDEEITEAAGAQEYAASFGEGADVYGDPALPYPEEQAADGIYPELYREDAFPPGSPVPAGSGKPRLKSRLKPYLFELVLGVLMLAAVLYFLLT